MWKELAGTDATRKAPLKITNLSLSFSGIESMETGQRTIEGFFAGKEKVSEDNGGSPGKPERKRRRSDVVNEDVGPSRLRVDHLAQNNLDDQDHEAELRHTEDQFAYTCDRCGRRIELPCSILSALGPQEVGMTMGTEISIPLSLLSRKD